ncbi:MAG: YlxM family DNA-binding protein [Clostridiales bacterium]|nr:YlxM family DNA-binding protein [Candidatus Blautia equi]
MEKILERTLLYDFYGELLTERQRQVYEEVVLEDLSLSEVAADLEISRQGVHDMIRRCDKALEEYEAKLHLVHRFLTIRGQVQKIQNLSEKIGAGEIKELSRQILEEL